MSTSILAIGAEQLGEELKPYVRCPHCDDPHEVRYGSKVEPDGSLTPSRLLAYVKCPDNNRSYLVGIDGHKFKP
jgi:phage terminase large subunit GpA-like protein